MNIGQLTAILSVNAAQLNLAAGALKKFETEANTSLNKVQLKLDSISSSMRTFGTAMSVGLTLPLVGLGYLATKTFREYELNLAHIIGLTGTSREQTAQWSTELMQLAKATAQGPNKLGDALYFIASSGIDDAQAMDVLTASAKSAAAGLGEVNKVADLVTSALNAYKGTGLTAAMVTDQLTAAVREGKAEAPGFAEAIGYAIPIAAQLGVSFDQVAAAMASVSGVGVDVNTAALYLRQVLSDLLKPSHQAEQALHDMGTSSAILRNELANKGLLPVLRTLSDLTAKYGKTMASVFPEVRSLTEVLALTGKNVEHVADIFDLVNNSAGDMEKALIPVTETLDYKFRQAITNSQIALISLGSALKGPVASALNFIAKAMENFANWFSSLDPEIQNSIVLFAGFVAAIGPALLILSGLTKGINLLIASFVSGTAPIAIFVAGLGFMVAETIKAINYISELNKVHNKFKQNIESESTNISVLFSALEKTNGSSAIRKNIIDQINQQYGQYLPHLITEKTSIAELKQLEEDLNKTMITGIALRAERESIESILTVQLQREKDFINDIIGQSEKMAKIAPMQSWVTALNDLAKMSPELRTFKNFGDEVAGEFDKSGQFIIKSVADLAKVTGSSYQGMVAELNELVAQRIKDKQSIEAVTATYKSYETTVNNVANALKNTAGGKTVAGVDVSGYSSAVEILKKYELELQKIAVRTQDAIYAEDTIKDKIKATEAVLNELVEAGYKPTDDIIVTYQAHLNILNSTLAVTNKITDDTTKSLSDQEKATERLDKKTLQLQNKLAILAYENSLVSDSWDATEGDKQYTLLTGKLQIYRQELQNLFDLQNSQHKSIDFSSEEIQIATEKIIGLQNELNQLDAQRYVVENLGGAFSNLTSILGSFNTAAELMGGTIDKDLQEFIRWIDLIVSTVSAISGLITFVQALTVASGANAIVEDLKTAALAKQAVAGASAATATKALSVAGVAAAATNKVAIASNILLASALTKTATAGALAASSWVPFPGNLAAMATSASTLITTLGTTLAATQALIVGPKLAEGGIVPPGYSNDTYPALLTSGEMVVPPGKLPQLSPTKVEVVVKVDGMTKGEDLYHMLKEVETRILNSY